MKKEKIEYYAHLTITVIGAIFASYVFIKYLFFAVLPFLIAWGVAFAIRPVARKISDGTKISYKIVSLTLTLLAVAGSLAVIISAISYAVGEAWSFLSSLGENEQAYKIIQRILNPIQGLLDGKEGAEEIQTHIGEAVKSMISSLLSGLLDILRSFVFSVPKILLFVLVTVISSIYFSFDLEKVNSVVLSKLPNNVSKKLVDFKNNFLTTVAKYLKAYLIMMLITFMTMLVGFIIIGVKYSVLLAFIVALLDALPLIGVGTVLVPWSVYELLFGNFSRGMGILILFVLHTVARQFIEPRVVGKNLGIHPILSVILLYLGYYFFGFFGLLFIPISAVVVKSVSQGK